MSEVGGLAYRFSGVQSSSQEQSSLGNYNREILARRWGGGDSAVVSRKWLIILGAEEGGSLRAMVLMSGWDVLGVEEGKGGEEAR